MPVSISSGADRRYALSPAESETASPEHLESRIKQKQYRLDGVNAHEVEAMTLI